MLRAVLSLFLMAMCLPAVAGDLIAAKVLVQARHPSGSLIQLHDVDGPCVDGAKLVSHIRPDGRVTQGCYSVDVDEGNVSIGWFNGLVAAIPLRAFKVPDEV